MLTRNVTWAAWPIMIILSGCYNTDIAWSPLSAFGGYTGPYAQITGPGQNTFINLDNASVFPLSGTCGPSGQIVNISGPVNATSPCGMNGTWSVTLNLSSIVYDQVATFSVSTGISPGQSAPVSMRSYNAVLCSSSSLASSTNPLVYGAGTVSSPYVICTSAQLQNLGGQSASWASAFKLMADLDLSAFSGSSFNIIGNSTTKFTGIFDGNGHSIANFSYASGGNGIGLFAQTQNATLKNLNLTNVNVSGQYDVGALLGRDLGSTTVTGCSSSGHVSASIGNVGGLLGNLNNTLVTYCHSSAIVDADNSAGGLIGVQLGSTNVTLSYATGSVTTINGKAGGLIGQHNFSSISQCYASGNVSGTASEVGGLIGELTSGATLTQSYATGNVSGSDAVGGLVGSQLTSASISDSYATGAVTASSGSGGGLVGKVVSGSSNGISRSYATGLVVGINPLGGILGSDFGSSTAYTGNHWDQNTTGRSTTAGLGSPESTAGMQNIATFSGWDFSAVTHTWKMPPTPGYPLLGWQ